MNEPVQNIGHAVRPSITARNSCKPTSDGVLSAYSETRVAVSRKHYTKVDATIRERRPCTKLTGLQGL